MIVGILDNPNPQLRSSNVPEKSITRSTSNRLQAFQIYDMIKGIKDPEHPYTLEQLDVVDEELIDVVDDGARVCRIRITFKPTVKHCSLATTIGLCLRFRLQSEMNRPFKLDIRLKPDSHESELEINKQINDKERVAAALENPALRQLVEECLQPVTS